MSRLEDLFSFNRSTPAFSSFLTPRQILIAEAFISQTRREEDALLFGGFSQATRRMLGVFSPHQTPDAALFPIETITLRYRPGDVLTHRDFLGACTALRITRESIGDIVPNTGFCTIFALSSVASVILQELKKVGNVGVRCETGASEEVVLRQEYDELRGTVSSMRLDCVVAMLTGLAREKSAKLIQSELVQLNHVVVTGVAKEVSSGDILSIRGRGKYSLDSIGNPTRKGRLPVVCRKYR